jgi:16S rRNA (cytosine1402-N4)-methyltransferase
MTYTKHYSVLYRECLDALIGSAKGDKTYIADLTFGGGGHTLGIAKEISNAHVISFDQDPDAYQNGLSLIRENQLADRIQLIKNNFENFPSWWEDNLKIPLNGVLLDLGVSSHHFDNFERGFSFREDAKLDMRMDYETNEVTAADVLNEYDEKDIADIIFKYGEEKYSRRIASNIVSQRKLTKFETTKQLEDIVFHCYPVRERFGRTHPATKTFQALRIYINRELEVLENTIEKLFSILAPHGVLVIISFHSLEDRIVKHKFREIFQSDKNAAKIITKKPILPSERELAENKRSRSAKLRIIEKLV